MTLNNSNVTIYALHFNTQTIIIAHFPAITKTTLKYITHDVLR